MEIIVSLAMKYIIVSLVILKNSTYQTTRLDKVDIDDVTRDVLKNKERNYYSVQKRGMIISCGDANFRIILYCLIIDYLYF